MTSDGSYPHYPDTLLRRLVAWISYPLIMGTVIGTTIALQQKESELVAGWYISCLLFVPLSIWLLESQQPHCQAWRPNWKENVRTDLLTLTVNGGLSAVLSEPLKVTIFAIIGSFLAANVPWSIWPSSLPLAMQFCIALLVADFGSYWYHRSMHEWPLGWRFHSVHHSSNRLYWLNAPRFHYVDITLYNLSSTIPLVLIGAPTECFVLVALFSACHGYFQHANYRVHLGPLNYIFSMAELHRWHHSKDIERANHNYGNNTIVWDWVFGSFYWPKTDIQASDDIGPGPQSMPFTFWGLFLAPFRSQQNQ